MVPAAGAIIRRLLARGTPHACAGTTRPYSASSYSAVLVLGLGQTLAKALVSRKLSTACLVPNTVTEYCEHCTPPGPRHLHLV